MNTYEGMLSTNRRRKYTHTNTTNFKLLKNLQSDSKPSKRNTCISSFPGLRRRYHWNISQAYLFHFINKEFVFLLELRLFALLPGNTWSASALALHIRLELLHSCM